MRILIGLALGVAVGAAMPMVGEETAAGVLAVVEPIGTLWLRALQMVVVPLVLSLVISGVASTASAASAGRLAARSLLTFVTLLLAASALSAFVTPALLAVFPLPTDAVMGLREALQESAGEVLAPPSLTGWFSSIIPANPIAAAAEGAVLQVVLFGLVFGFAIAKLAPEAQSRLVTLFQSIADAMLVIVHWILLVAPLGVFALAAMVAARSGLAVAGTLVHYVVIVSIVCALLLILAYPLAALGGRVPLLKFAKAVAPAQIVAFSTQSSLASLPAMIEAAQEGLGVGRRIAGLVLPLAVATFRISSPAANLAVAIYVAHVSGVALTAPTLALGVVVAVIISLAGAGVASHVTFFSTITPICMAMGVPIEMLALLIAVETVPDILRTGANVTTDVAVTTLLAARTPDDFQE